MDFLKKLFGGQADDPMMMNTQSVNSNTPAATPETENLETEDVSPIEAPGEADETSAVDSSEDSSAE